MCRHLVSVGQPVRIGTLLFDLPHSLCEQAARPWHQAPGRVNRDGWGVGWYGPDGDIVGWYRTATAMWDDRAFDDAGADATALLAAARLASPGSVLDRTGNAPFRVGSRLFSLNGYVQGFTDGAGDALRAGISETRREAIEGDSDSEVLFAMVLDRLDAGDTPEQALAGTVERVTKLADAKLNMLLTDGATAHATRWGNSLFARGGVVVSEPLDDDPEWAEIPDASVVTVDPRGSSSSYATWTAL